MTDTPHPADGIELRVLGQVGLRRGGEPLQGVLAQPKRFGLLVYLALRRPERFLSRDELLGVFWPDSTEKRARASLRQALRFLRTHLGRDTIVNRGANELRVAPGAVRCDAVRLLDALDERDDRRARDRYGGELLPGFALAGVYEFDRWLQAERQRLRAAVIQAALRLAGDAESRGDLAGAAGEVRWALRQEPTNEAVARRLITLLAHAGSRSAALSAYEALEARLAEELDLAPSPETVELVDAVRDARLSLPGGDGGRTLSARRILVLGLDNRTGDPDLRAIGRLAADVVAQGLATIRELEVVPPMAVGVEESDRATPHRDGPELTPELAELARRAGAGTVVDGAFYRDGDRIRLHARITDAIHGTLMEAPDPVAGSVSDPLDALGALRDRVMATLAPALTRRAVHVREAARPPNLQAYTAYLEGLELFIRGRWREALSHFAASAERAPDYALPRLVRAIALWNLEELDEARTAALEAAGLRDSLGRFERSVLDTVLAWLKGDWAAAHEAVRIQAEMAPGSIPHFQVAEEARRLNRPREAREVLAALDPEAGELRGWIFYWMERTAALHMVGDHVRELELASRCRRLHPDDPVAALLEVRALAALGRHDEVTRLLDRALASPGSREPRPGALLREAALELRAHHGTDAATPILERAVDWYRARVTVDPSDRLRRDLARTLYHAGDLTDARRIFAELSRGSAAGVRPVGHHHGQLQAHLDEGYLAAIAVRQGDEASARRWSQYLEDLDRPFLYGAQWLWLAAVAALRQEPERAVTMLRRAFADGLPFELFLHTDPHLQRLRGHPPFDALMRPRG